MKRAVRAIVVQGNSILVMHRNKFGLDYYTLVGGGVEMNESLEQALYRELAEETGIKVNNPRLVFTERASPPYGDQYIFLCDYISGNPQLSASSDEAKINAMGKNTYTPTWLPLDQLAELKLRSDNLRDNIIDGLKNGFPAQPKLI